MYIIATNGESSIIAKKMKNSDWKIDYCDGAGFSKVEQHSRRDLIRSFKFLLGKNFSWRILRENEALQKFLD